MFACFYHRDAMPPRHNENAARMNLLLIRRKSSCVLVSEALVVVFVAGDIEWGL
jgi:hypothetical protein